MAKFERTKIGNLALVQETKDGRIRQIGLTENQSEQLQQFMAIISQGQPLVQMGEEYDLIIKPEPLLPLTVEEEGDVSEIYFNIALIINKKNEVQVIDTIQHDYKDFVDCDTFLVEEVRIDIV